MAAEQSTVAAVTDFVLNNKLKTVRTVPWAAPQGVPPQDGSAPPPAAVAINSPIPNPLCKSSQVKSSH